MLGVLDVRVARARASVENITHVGHCRHVPVADRSIRTRGTIIGLAFIVCFLQTFPDRFNDVSLGRWLEHCCDTDRVRTYVKSATCKSERSEITLVFVILCPWASWKPAKALAMYIQVIKRSDLGLASVSYHLTHMHNLFCPRKVFPLTR